MKKYNVVVATDVGYSLSTRMIWGVGWQLSEYGTYDAAELQSVRTILRMLRNKKPNLVALDIGANFLCVPMEPGIEISDLTPVS